MKNLIVYIIFICNTVNALAQAPISHIPVNSEKNQLTLEECIISAIENNPNLKSLKLSEEANEYQIKEIKSAALPQLSAQGQVLHNYALAEQILPGEVFGQPGESVAVKFGVANTITGKVEVNQLLYNKSYRTGLRAAEASRSLTQLNTFKTTEDLIFNIAELYLNLQITEKQKEILNANLSRINQLIKISQIQFEEGLIKKLDVDQLRVNKTNLLSEFQNIEIGVAQQMNLLKFYMGMTQDEEIAIADYVTDGDTYPLLEAVQMENNTSLLLLNKQLELSNLEHGNLAAGYYPTLSAFANYGWQGQTDKLFSTDEQYDIQGSPTGVIGLSLNIPIFDGFKIKNQLAQNKIKQSQMVLDRTYLANSIQMEFANANNALKQNKTLLDVQNANMALAEELYGVTKLSYQEGVAPLTELLNAENSLKEAQTQYLTSLLQVNLAELDQMKTSGQLASLIRDGSNN